MRLTRRTLLAASAASIAVAGCVGDETDDEDDGSTDDDQRGDDQSDGGPTATGEPQDVTVEVRSHPDFGDILVDGEGLTLYSFDADTQGEPESACYDDCADAWPTLTVEEMPAAGDDVAAELTTFERDEGSMQVAANGWPLYYFQGDDEPGDASGQGLHDGWWVVRPDGTPIRNGEEATENGTEDEGGTGNENGTEDEDGDGDQY